MTRKAALIRAISIISQTTMPLQERDELTRALQLCLDELPYAKWTKEAIFDALDQFCIENGRTWFTLAELDRTGLPSHCIIKWRFGMTAKEFRDRYYPMPPQNERPRKAPPMSPGELQEDFIKRYRELQPKNGSNYNARRPGNAPSWNVVARAFGLTHWYELLELCGLKRVPAKLNVSSRSHSGVVELIKKYDALAEQRGKVDTV